MKSQGELENIIIIFFKKKPKVNNFPSTKS